ncbi:MAG TPA: hypothetical protein PLL30_17830 [Candidatus Krumholzibacteria bacterium]|nr:hypothetical protein [Candidatus Krumholzibacteria bacterium]HPD73639.1 hypothetical protein [Candidatus Krumholzibacteria bacterium]HRY42226.1 hypothetical protein [Candidatus Krumholzibacteria bacterium]
MTDDVIGNGSKAWALLMSKIDGVHQEVRDARGDIVRLGDRVTRVEARLDGLPCEWRGRKIDEMAESIGKLKNVQTSALSKRQLAAALLTAAIAGAGVAARFL